MKNLIILYSTLTDKKYILETPAQYSVEQVQFAKTPVEKNAPCALSLKRMPISGPFPDVSVPKAFADASYTVSPEPATAAPFLQAPSKTYNFITHEIRKCSLRQIPDVRATVHDRKAINGNSDTLLSSQTSYV